MDPLMNALGDDSSDDEERRPTPPPSPAAAPAAMSSPVQETPRRPGRRRSLQSDSEHDSDDDNANAGAGPNARSPVIPPTPVDDSFVPPTPAAPLRHHYDP